MGGKNHQPCRSYLLNSTQMSRAMSLAFISVKLANVALKDLIKDFISLTGDLTVRVRECSEQCKTSGIHVELEENSRFNFKPEFAKLYTARSSFQQVS